MSFNFGGAGSGLGSIGAGIWGMSQDNNPADAGMGYLGAIGPTITPYYQPYINAGNSAMAYMQGPLMQKYGQLMNDPTGFMNGIGKTFQQSPGYQFQVNQALGAANRAAAAGGMVGSPMEQQNIAGTVNNLANQDYYHYLNNALGVFGQGMNGLTGLNENMFNTGFNASNSLANNLAQALSAQAQMAYAGKNQENQTNAGYMGDITGGIGSLASSFGF